MREAERRVSGKRIRVLDERQEAEHMDPPRQVLVF
jgi:hypothetical protein